MVNFLSHLGHRIAAGVIFSLFIQITHAGEFPEKPIQIVSPYSAGGTNDFLARMMAQRMGAQLKINVVVENRAGANGIVGSAYVAKTNPDGYTMLLGNSATHGTNPTLYPDQPYDSIKDFAPVSMVGSVPIVLVVNSSLGINNIDELIAYGKANPGKLAFGSSGVGGTGHLAGEALKAAANIDMVHAPYKGDAPAVLDAMGGQVAVAFVGVASAVTQTQAGKIKIIGIAHANRVASLPKVPTFAEAGFKDLEFSQWYALVVRGGTPRTTVEKLSQTAKTVLERDDVQKSMRLQGAEYKFLTPDELSAFFKSEIQRFSEIIRRLNIKVG